MKAWELSLADPDSQVPFLLTLLI